MPRAPYTAPSFGLQRRIHFDSPEALQAEVSLIVPQRYPYSSNSQQLSEMLSEYPREHQNRTKDLKKPHYFYSNTTSSSNTNFFPTRSSLSRRIPQLPEVKFYNVPYEQRRYHDYGHSSLDVCSNQRTKGCRKHCSGTSVVLSRHPLYIDTLWLVELCFKEVFPSFEKI